MYYHRHRLHPGQGSQLTEAKVLQFTPGHSLVVQAEEQEGQEAKTITIPLTPSSIPSFPGTIPNPYWDPTEPPLCRLYT